jgi:plasmid stability protein
VPSKEDPDRAARLLLKALDSLTQRDRDLVLRNLLTGRIGSVSGRGPSHGHATEAPPSFSEAKVGMEITRQVEQPLLVRLPADLHARFRRWATSHGFSMASVVRGLVERFLDDQEGRGRPGGGRS